MGKRSIYCQGSRFRKNLRRSFFFWLIMIYDTLGFPPSFTDISCTALIVNLSDEKEIYITRWLVLVYIE